MAGPTVQGQPSAVTCSGRQPLVQSEGGQPGESLGKGRGQPLAHPGHAWSSWPRLPRMPPPYQGSRQDEEPPRLSPKAHGDQLAEGRAAAPALRAHCVLEAVHSSPEPWLLAGLPCLSTPLASLTRQPSHLAAWLMSKEREEAALKTSCGVSLAPWAAHWPWPRARKGQYRALAAWEAPGLMPVGALCLLSPRVSS